MKLKLLLPVVLVLFGAWLLWPGESEDDYYEDDEYFEDEASGRKAETEADRYLALRGIRNANFVKPGWTPEAEAEHWRERSRARTVAPTEIEFETAPDGIDRPDEIRRTAPDAVEIR